MNAALRRVMAFGTFDLLHLGHLAYLEWARRLGVELVVVVTSDAWARKEKGRAPHFSGRERARLVAGLKPVDRAVLGSPRDKFAVVERLRPSVLALGYDQKVDVSLLRLELAARGLKAKVVRAGKPYESGRYKSTRVRAYLKRER